MMAAQSDIDPAIKRAVWAMVAVMALSFIFGIAMFLPAEHRAEKLTETMQRYQARTPDADQTIPLPRKRPEY